MRAGYAALILGVVGGLWLASRTLSVSPTPPPATVAATLALDVKGSDIDARRSEAVAVLITRCMWARGIAWEPWVEPGPSVPDAGLEPVTWAERWGFGVSTTLGLRAVATPADPNLSAVEALPSDGQARYRDALYGTSESDAGCQRTANDAVYGLRERLIGPLRPALTDLDARIAADQGAIQAVEAWRACVSPIAGRVIPERRTLAGQLIAGFDTRAQAFSATPTTTAGLVALQAEERRVAAILARCEARFADARAAVAAPFEAAFVAEHRDELMRIGASIRDAEAALPTLPP